MLLYVLAVVNTMMALFWLHTAIKESMEKVAASSPTIAMWLLSAIAATLSWIKVLI